MDPRVRAALEAMFAGRPVIVTGGPVAGLARVVPEVTELSGQRPFLLANGLGTGPLPGPDEAELHVLPTTGSASLVRSVHEGLHQLAHLPADALAAIDAWDTAGRAVVLASHFFTGTEIAGRPTLGGRRPEWEALEDKTTVDDLWDEVGVRRARARVVNASYDVLSAASLELDDGGGTVWSGDAREGFNGGAELVRWVRTEQQARTAAEFFAAHCDRVRVMPFLDGIPCSIHGVVFPDGIATLRPVEMLTLRRVGEGADRLLYGGMSTYWDPHEADRGDMRSVARRVAHALRDRVGFLGGFSVDGVLTADGFLPTELNPRFSGGLSAIAKGVPDFPLNLVLTALVSEVDPGLTAVEFESLLLPAADRHRWGGGGLMLDSVQVEQTETRPVRISGGSLRLADEAEQPDAELMIGPAATGAYLRFEPLPGVVPAGRSLAPLVTQAFALSDQLWGTDIGPTRPADDVRIAQAPVSGVQ